MNFFNKINLGSISNNLAFLVMLAVLPTVVILLFSGMEQRQHSIAYAKQDVMLLAHSMAEAQKGNTTATRQILSTLAQMPAVQSLNVEASSELLRAMTAQNPEYLGLTLTDINGEVLASDRPFTRINLADRKHVREALTSKDFAVGEYIVTRVGEKFPSLPFAYPVLDKAGNLKGVLTAARSLLHFARFFDVSALPTNSFLGVTDHQGIRLFYYPPKEGTNPIGKAIHAPNWEVAQKTKDPGIFIQQGSDGIRRIIAFEQISFGSDDAPYMYAWAGIPEEQILKPANTALIRNLLLIFLFTVLALSLSWAIGRITLISPIKRLVATTQSFARGDLDARTNLPGMSGELGTLAQSFHDMAAEITKSQARLQEREAHLEEAQRIAHIGSWEWDVASDTAVWSKELYRILGADPATPALAPGAQDKLYSPESILKMRAAVATTLQTGVPYEIEMERKKEKGTSSWLLARGEARSDTQGAITGLRGTALDITARKLAEEERGKMQAQLLQAQKMESIGRLAGGVAHDFNNMLSVILGYTEMALTKVNPAESLHRDLQSVQQAAQRSAELTRQLLAFARKQTVAPEVLNLNDTLEALLKMMRRLLGEDVELAWLPASNLWLVKMDPSQVDQIMMNLCINARDAIAGVGRITIETTNLTVTEDVDGKSYDSAPGDYVMLTVRDDGCGMAKETLANIFEPFFTTKEVGQGTGLGLATVFGIVKQNQGFINVDSEPGKGTTFTIYLPRVEETTEEAGAGSAAQLPPSNGETVLLAEDDPMVMGMTNSMLESLGYKLLIANTPGDAIRLAAEHIGKIDLLLTDIVMPETNGRDLAKTLQAKHPKLKCLFMSGYPLDIITKQGILEEDFHFLQKPFTFMALAQQVRKALAQR